MVENVYHNYDAVFKDSFILYKDKSLDFIRWEDDAKITEILSTEKKEVRVETEFTDITFKTNKGYGLHMESEVDVSEADMLRFCGYSVDLWARHKIEFRTIVITTKKPRVKSVKGRTLQFTPIIVNLGRRNGDKIYKKLKKKIDAGEEVNELDLIFLPLCSSKTKSTYEMLVDCIGLAEQIADDETNREKMVAQMLILTNKYVDEERINKLWREFSAVIKLKVLKVAESVGRKEGREEGREELFGILENLQSEGMSLNDALTQARQMVNAQANASAPTSS